MSGNRIVGALGAGAGYLIGARTAHINQTEQSRVLATEPPGRLVR
jgi:hypothetical protein